MTTALGTGRPARITGERLAQGPFGAIAGRLGLRAAVATPVVAGGQYWGVTVAATSREDFPADTESRMADFIELAGMAIANAEAEQRLRELADTQASLRRLAMLVAQGESPGAVFAAVTRETLRHFGIDTARMIRFELDGTATLVANEGTTAPHVRVGRRWEGYPATGLTATGLRTGRAARVDDYGDIPGGEPYLAEGLRSAVAMPVHVQGRLWGMIAVGSGQGPLPPDTEQRMTRRASRGAQPRWTSAAISCQSTWSATTSASGLGMPSRASWARRHWCTGRSSSSMVSGWAGARVGCIASSPIPAGLSHTIPVTHQRSRASREAVIVATGVTEPMQASVPEFRLAGSGITRLR